MKDRLEMALDNVFNEIHKEQKKAFWSNREPKQRIGKQERATINALSNFIPAVNNAPSKERATKHPHRSRKSSTVTARG
ncbi:hypothetical protein [Xenorhabdus koppenhoeferi]|uniref:Uncharacterized protein n=1 Tax=Xenorhabdus koppenhoeferi TaxID=351659 RepID=A0A1I7K8N9_9GAMM|nr:hypothetical protein [Xenorhabdus koppenhoeferi]SFU93765.1 hypothetical protein SAMN05421784_14925 [Xenorhabdus koppenhoeferi]